MRVTVNKLKEFYKRLLEEKDEEVQEQMNFELGTMFWGLKTVRRDFEKLIGTEKEPKRINPNPYDTPTYWSMKPSEQGNVEGMFLDYYLAGEPLNLLREAKKE